MEIGRSVFAGLRAVDEAAYLQPACAHKQFEGAGGMLPVLAVSGDGKHLYLSGLGHSRKRAGRRMPYTGFPAVLRVNVKTRKVEVFVGDPKTPGKREIGRAHV